MHSQRNGTNGTNGTNGGAAGNGYSSGNGSNGNGNGHAGNGNGLHLPATNGHAARNGASQGDALADAVRELAGSSSGGIHIRDLLAVAWRHKYWAVFTLVMGITAIALWVNFGWVRQSTARATLYKPEELKTPLQQLSGIEDNDGLDSEAVRVTSEQNAWIIARLVDLADRLGPGDRSPDPADRADPVHPINQATEEAVRTVVLDVATGEILPAEAAFDVDHDVMLIGPIEVQLARDSFWDPAISDETRAQLRRQAATNPTALVGSVGARADRSRRTLTVSCTSTDPAEAMLKANLAAAAFLTLTTRNYQRLNRQQVFDARELLERSLSELSKAEDDLNTALRKAFEQLRGVGSASITGFSQGDLMQLVSRLEAQMTELETRRRALQEQLVNLRQNRYSLFLANYVDPARQRLTELLQRRADAAIQLQPGNDEVRVLDDQIAGLEATIARRREMLEALAARLDQLQKELGQLPASSQATEADETRRRELEVEIEGARQRFATATGMHDFAGNASHSRTIIDVEMAGRQRELDELLGQIDILHEQLRELRIRLEDGELASLDHSIQQHRARVELLNSQISTAAAALQRARLAAASIPQRFAWERPAEMSRISHSSPMSVITMGIGATLAFALLVTFLRGQFDVRIHTAQDVEKHTGLRILGRVPMLPGRAREATFDPAALHPVFGSIAFSIRDALGRKHSRGRVVQITSAMASEGKSTLSTSIAVYSARQGLRVCLLVGDVYRPSDLIVGALPPGRPGWLQLTDENPPAFEDLLTPIAGLPHFSVVTPGRSDLDAVAVLESDPFHSFIEYLRDSYDLIVVDSVPVVPVIEGLVLGRMVDAAVLVVRSRRITQELLRRTVEQLGFVNVPLIGAIVNFAPTDAGYGNYKYGYYRPARPSDPAAQPDSPLEADTASAAADPASPAAPNAATQTEA